MKRTHELHKLIELLSYNNTIDIDFLTPSTAALIACACHRSKRPPVNFANDMAQRYGEYSQLTNVLSGYHANARVPSYKNTCSRLCQVKDESDIDIATASIKTLLSTYLAHGMEVVKSLVRVIGELHDNIYSHAEGLGYSMAQVYRGSTPRVEVAVVDAGIGLKRSVRTVQPVGSDREALSLCIGKGFSTKKEVNSWAQSLELGMPNPFGPGITTRTSTNNHQGLGLYLLTDLIRRLDGKLWICTGNGSLIQNGGKIHYTENRWVWQGTAIRIIVNLVNRSSRSLLGISPQISSHRKLRVREALGL